MRLRFLEFAHFGKRHLGAATSTLLAKAIAQDHPDEIYDPNVTPQLAPSSLPPFYLSDSRLGDMPRRFAVKKNYFNLDVPQEGDYNKLHNFS